MRDALNLTGRPMLFSTEPFSIHPDPEQSVKVSNLWRVGCDISPSVSTFLDRADLSDKWAPLAGPGGWNDPDMIHVANPPVARNDSAASSNGFTLGENRLYFGLWALMKAPLLLSADLPSLNEAVIAIVNNSGLIAVNQDPLGVQARKLMVGAPEYDGVLRTLPWKIGIEDCARSNERWYTRSLDPALQGKDTREWRVERAATASGSVSGSTGYILTNTATDRCLAVSGPSNASGEVVLMPCNRSAPSQVWSFDDGIHTVSSLTNTATGEALAVANTTLRAAVHSPGKVADTFATPDASYGLPPLQLVPPYAQPACKVRSCQEYDPTQKWYYSPTDGRLRHSLFTASINDRVRGEGYQLTTKVPTWRHHCLAHVLSDQNGGTPSGHTEVWGGPLAAGGFVLALVNRYTSATTITAPFSALGVPSVGAESSFEVRDLWAAKAVGRATGRISARVEAHDMAVFRLSP